MVAVLEARGAPGPATFAARRPTARVSLSDRALGLVAVGLLVSFSTVVYGVFWAPKAALLLPVVVPGCLALLDAARRRVPGACWCLAFVVAAGLSMLLADRVWLSLLGTHNLGTGWLFIVALAGLWALGARVSEAGVAWIERAVLVGCVACAALAWVQTGIQLPVDALALVGGRAVSFLGNSVHVAAVGAAGVWLAVSRGFGRRLRGYDLFPIALLAGSVQLSGSRAGLVPLVGVALVAAWRLGRRRAVPFLLAVLIGVTGASAVARSAGTEAVSATRRAAVSLNPGSLSERLSDRTAVWRASVGAVAERPLLGWGPGRLRTAISPRVGPEMARYAPPGQEYGDAHNFVVEYAVTTGVAGVFLMGLWLVASGRRARGPLAGFAAVVGLVGLLQPQSVAVTPVAVLALGVATRRASGPWSSRRRGIGAVGAAAAMIVALVFLAGEASLARAATELSPNAARRAERLLPPWPEVSEVGSQVAAFEAVARPGPEDWRVTIKLAAEAVRRDPADSNAWVDLADLQMRAGNRDAARRAYEEALERHRWNRSALNGTIFLAEEAGEAARVDDLCVRRAQVVVEGEGDCLEAVRQVYGD